MNKFQELLSLEENVRVRDYSGRNMYCRVCLSITGSHQECMQALASVIVEASKTLESARYCDFVHDALRFKQDNMGYDVVLYWPTIEFETPDDELTEDADDV